jgi:glucokinase
MAGGCCIGVDLGGTKLIAGAVDSQLTVRHRAWRSSRGADRSEVLDTIVDAITEARDASDEELLAVGVGIPSLLDLERGVPVTTVHLPLTDVPVRDILSERLGVPVVLDNDATCATIAEWRFGAARGASDVLVLTLGTGIGGGIVTNGQLVRGATGAAGELGHMIVDEDGPLCACGHHGCLEAVASGSALGREGLRVARALEQRGSDSALARALAAGQEITGFLVTELAHDGDPAARDVVALIGARLGVGIASLVNGFNPEVVVVGGGVSAAGELLLQPARDVVAARALSPSRDVVKIVPARFGAESGMLGAASLAWDEVQHDG